MAKKMTAEKGGEFLLILSDESSATTISLRIAEAAAEPMEEDDGEGEYFSTGPPAKPFDARIELNRSSRPWPSDPSTSALKK